MQREGIQAVLYSSRPGAINLSPLKSDFLWFDRPHRTQDGSMVFISQAPAQLDKGVRIMVRYSQLFPRGESTRGTCLSVRRVLPSSLDRVASMSLSQERDGKKSGNFSFNLTGVDDIGKIESNPCLGGVNCFSGMSSRIISDAPVIQQEVVGTAQAANRCEFILLAESLLEQ